MLIRIAFFVASPALMITVLSRTDVSRLFSANLVASVASVVVAATTYIAARPAGLATYVERDRDRHLRRRVRERREPGPADRGVRAGRRVAGRPDAADPAARPAAPRSAGARTSPRRRPTTRRPGVAGSWSILSRIVRNPLTVGSLLGLLLSVFGVPLPPLVTEPLNLIAGMAVPAMLLAYGVSLRLGPLPGAGEPPIQIATIVALKLVVQPLVRLPDRPVRPGPAPVPTVFAVTVIAALPTAQNVFTHAVRYHVGVILARDTIFYSTILSVPVIVALTALLT